MKEIKFFGFVLMTLLLVSCGKEKSRGPFNYELVKSQLDLNGNQQEKFDAIEEEHTSRIKEIFSQDEGNKEEKLVLAKKVSTEQDQAMKSILTNEQFQIYVREIGIEREGREKHNMKLILSELQLDSVQKVQYNTANTAFYTTLVNNHDYYHGKPDVYLQYYKEIDVSRQRVFESIMTDNQYQLYQKLEKQYKIGQNEH